MALLDDFDRWNAAARSRGSLHLFAWLCRIALCIAFIPSGWTKIAGHRFTRMSLHNPVGLFFEGLYSTGIYWRFLGLAQWFVALLIVLPRTRTLGAVLYFPVILNIFLITVGIGMKGTWFVTSLMLLASLFLLAWDWPRLRRAGRALLEAKEAEPVTGAASSLKLKP